MSEVFDQFRLARPPSTVHLQAPSWLRLSENPFSLDARNVLGRRVAISSVASSGHTTSEGMSEEEARKAKEFPVGSDWVYLAFMSADTNILGR